MASAESADIVYHVTSLVAVACLIGLYLFGVWSRCYVMPSPQELPLRKQLVAAIPVGLVTMGTYAKTALPTLAQSPENIPFDLAAMAGFAIAFGMLSRESLERLLQAAAPKLPGV
jgi:hypothetical protein